METLDPLERELAKLTPFIAAYSDEIVHLVRRKASTRFGPNRPPVLNQGIPWLWQTPAGQVGAKRRTVWDHVPWSMVRCGRCSTFLIDSPFRRILCEL